MTTSSFFQGYGSTLAIFTSLVSGKELLDDSLGWRADSIGAGWTAFGDCFELGLSIRTNEAEIERWLDKGLGRHLEFYSPGLSRIWSGYCAQVNANLGTLTLTRGPLLDVVANRVRVVYGGYDSSTEPPTPGARITTAWYEDAVSQARYGIIEQVKSVGFSNAAIAAQIAQTVLADKKDPETKESETLDSPSEPSLSLTFRGYVNWLNVYTYNQTAVAGDIDADAKIKAILDADPNGIFNVDQSAIQSNASTQVSAWEDDDDIALSIIKGIVALGDDDYNRWTFGVDQNRKASYGPIPNVVEYQRTRSAPEQRVELYGTGLRVLPWNVRPNKWVFYTDLLTTKPPTRTPQRDDPRFAFLEQVTYSTPWGLKLDGAQVSRTDQLLDRLGLGGSA